MSVRPRVGLLGGTFDPIHAGHLALARGAEQALDLECVRFTPSARPPHRTDSPQASGSDRLEMIRRAIAETSAGHTRWEASDLELRREGTSYSFDTLSALHNEGLAPSQIFFITGADAFADIATWHRYPDVLDAAHFAVVARPGTTIESLRQRLPSLAPRMIPPVNLEESAGPRIVLIEAATPDVSSTDIRRRAARGESLEGLVSPSVAAYIAQHSLYRTAPDAPIAPIAPVAPDSGA